MSRRYDHLFRAHGGALPISFLRALAYSESKLRPDYELKKGIDLDTRIRRDNGKKDSYWGLFQVGVKNVLPGYNSRSGYHADKEQLFDASMNTRIAAWHINDMVRNYADYAQRYGIDNLKPNWNNLEFVRLLLAGWNSGHSRAAGVQAAALWLHKKGLPVTHENIFLPRGKALKFKKGKLVEGNKTKYLKRPAYHKKQIWQAKVARRYFEQRGLDGLAPPPSPGGGGLIAAGLLGLGLLVIKSVG
jgi:hypothetical protein